MIKKLTSILTIITILFTMSFSMGTVYADDNAQSAELVGKPIYTARELLNISEKKGDYYLANDIDLIDYPNCQIRFFEGTLDGNGHTIYNYTVNDVYESGDFSNRSYLFSDLRRGSTLKNFSLEDVNIKYISKGPEQMHVYGLLTQAWNVTVENVSISGEMNVKVDGDQRIVSMTGLIGECYESTVVKNCESDIDIFCEVISGNIESASITGLLTSCDETTKIEKCRNTGDLEIIISENANVEYIDCVGGIDSAGNWGTNLTSCSNSGDITVKNYGKIKPNVVVTGTAGSVSSLTKCYNKGDISLDGRFGNTRVAGIALQAKKMSQCYNKGKISANFTVKPKKDLVNINGITTFIYNRLTNSYNAGKIAVTGKWNGGAVTGLIGSCSNDARVSSCYSSGKITVPYGVKAGAIMSGKRGTLKNNYFRYGTAFITGKTKSSQAKKVNAITKKNCPNLSSDYWMYSKSKKRMLLKQNKE